MKKTDLTPEQLKKRRKINGITLTIFGSIILLFIVLNSLFTTTTKEPPLNESLLQLRMERTAKNLILQKLKAPSTAEFGPIEYLHKGNDITMRGYVDAQNSFGAMLRNKWYVVINFTGTTNADLDSTQKMKLILNELVSQ